MTLQAEFVEQIQRHQALLNKLVYLYADQTEDCDDLHQEILLQAWRSYSTKNRKATDLTDQWKAVNWQTSEFSYAKTDLLTKLKKESTSDIAQLLTEYKRLYASTLALTGVTPLFALLKPHDPECLFSIALIWSYCLILSGFLTVKFVQFKRPDLSLKPAEFTRASLTFVRSINSFQVNFLVPVILK